MKTSFHSTSRGAGKFLALASLAVALAGSALAAGSASDLLEQGIYSEETKGDLPGAVQLYQQVITASKANEALAAQAQYHLGVCYYKQQDFTNATAAFEALAKDYPDQKDLVALARKYLAGADSLQPAPWQDGEELHLDIKVPSGMKIGYADYWVYSATNNGQKIWQLVSHVAAGAPSFSRVEVEADSFKPIHSRWKHPLLGDVDATYFADHADLKTAGKDDTKTLSFDGPILDNEEYVQWVRRLPLAEGYSTTRSLLASLGNHIVPVKATVSGPEKIDVPAGSFQCFKVDLSIAQTFWYSADANRYLVKFEAGGVSAELSSIKSRLPGEPATLENAAIGYSLSAPAGWILDQSETRNPNKTRVAIDDPEATSGGSELATQTLDSLKPENKTTPRALAEHGLKEPAEEHKNFLIRTNSWTDLTVAGQPAVSAISDFSDGNRPSILYSVYTLGATTAEAFNFGVAAKDFDRLRPQFDAIVASFKIK